MARPHMLWNRRPRRASARPSTEDDGVTDLTAEELSGVFAPPGWLRDLGTMSWLLVGVFLLLAAIVALLSLTNTIVTPVIVASIVAAVMVPVVDALQRRGVGRAAGAALVFLGIFAAGVALVVMVLAGVASQTSGIQARLGDAVTKFEGWLHDAGVSQSTANKAGDDASKGISDAFGALVHGVSVGISSLASLAVFLSFTALSLFFLLKDGPAIRRWTESHLGLPPAIGRLVTGRMLQALRGYFAGVTIVAGFNAVVIGLGALILGVPLAGSIMVINFVAAYIPYLGAWSAGAFTVLVALGSQGPAAGLAMAVIALLANGALQQLVQPLAMGAALDLHPLAVLIVTIAGGGLFGTVGLILAAPVTSAALRLSGDIARARSQENRAPPAEPEPSPSEPIPSTP
jgi:predicted PurR-regulated permease PerM